MTSHYLKIAALGHPFELKIEPKRFLAIATAFRGLREIVRVEEQWDAAIQNYIELERNLLDTAARAMIVHDFDIQIFNDLRLRFGVRLSNVLSSCKAYIDQTPQRLNKLAISGIKSADFQSLTNDQYDARFGYRLMEALRNHAQHHGLPIHGATYHRSRVETNGESLLKYSVATKINVDELRENKDFKPSILSELSSGPISAEPHVRDYIEGLSAIHDVVRERLKSQIAEWLREIESAITIYRDYNREHSLVGLAAYELSDDSAVIQELPLTTGMVERIRQLQKRNRHLINLGKRFVTSAPE